LTSLPNPNPRPKIKRGDRCIGTSFSFTNKRLPMRTFVIKKKSDDKKNMTIIAEEDNG
jgi:hypothetical protein